MEYFSPKWCAVTHTTNYSRIQYLFGLKILPLIQKKLDGAMSEAPFGEDHHGNHNSFLNTGTYITGR